MFEIPCKSGVYMIRNTKNMKIYIGSSINMERRRKEHFRLLKGGKHRNAHLQNAYKIDGESAFVFFPIAFVKDHARLVEIEQSYMDSYLASNQVYGYNSRPRAETNLGRKCSPETLKKMRLAVLGKKQSAETIEKRTGMQLGRKLPPEWCSAISEGKKGKSRPDIKVWASEKFSMFNPEQVAAMRKAREGGKTYQAIADEFGCCMSTAHFAVNGTGAFYSSVK